MLEYDIAPISPKLSFEHEIQKFSIYDTFFDYLKWIVDVFIS